MHSNHRITALHDAAGSSDKRNYKTTCLSARAHGSQAAVAGSHGPIPASWSAVQRGIARMPDSAVAVVPLISFVFLVRWRGRSFMKSRQRCACRSVPSTIRWGKHGPRAAAWCMVAHLSDLMDGRGSLQQYCEYHRYPFDSPRQGSDPAAATLLDHSTHISK